MENDVVRTPDKFWGGKRCECAVCGTIEVCTFEFDFYPIEIGGKKLLQCERCLLKEHFGTAYPPKITLGPDGSIEED